MINNKQQFLAKGGFIGIIILIFACYGLYISKNFLMGPQISIEFPQKGEIVYNAFIEIKGKAKNISHINLNGARIFTDAEGNFKQNLLLANGYNIIEIYAQDKFGREIKERREIVFKQTNTTQNFPLTINKALLDN